jgi:hypothetical protein
MKNRKKIIIISLVSICVLAIAYFLYKYLTDEDLDKISKKVTIASYESHFLKSIEKQFNKPYDQFDEQGKYDILKKMISDNNPVCRIVSARYLSKLSNKEKSLEVLAPAFNDKSPEVIEEAIFSLLSYPKEKVEPLLKDKMTEWNKDNSKDIPMNDILRVGILGSASKTKVDIAIEESLQNQINLNDGTVYEINLLIPKGYEYILSFPNFDDNWESLIDSKIISRFSKSDTYEDFKRIDYISSYFKVKKIIQDKVSFLSKYFVPERLFRDDLKVAKYGSDMLFVTFKGRNLELFTNLINVFKTSSDSKFYVQEDTYNNIKVVTIKNRANQNVLSYADISEYFICSASPELLKKSIDCFQTDNTKSATFDPNFQTDYNKLDVTGKNNFMFAFFQPSVVSGLKGEYNYSAYFVKISSVVLKKLLGDSYDLSPVLGNDYFSKERDENILRFFSKDILGFYFSNNAKPANFWNYVVNVRADVPETVAKFENQSKFKVKENIINKMTSPVMLGYSGIDYMKNIMDRFSSPKISFACKLKNSEKIELDLKEFFNYLFEKPVEKVMFEGYEINSSGPYTLNTETHQNVDNSLAPSYIVIDNYLLIGTNPGIIMNMIRTYKGSNPSIKDLNIFSDSPASKVFVNIGAFLTDYYKFLAKYSSKSSNFNQFEIENKIKPLFEILKLMKDLDYRSEMNDFQYKSKITLNID